MSLAIDRYRVDLRILTKNSLISYSEFIARELTPSPPPPTPHSAHGEGSLHTGALSTIATECT